MPKRKCCWRTQKLVISGGGSDTHMLGNKLFFIAHSASFQRALALFLRKPEKVDNQEECFIKGRRDNRLQLSSGDLAKPIKENERLTTN